MAEGPDNASSWDAPAPGASRRPASSPPPAATPSSPSPAPSSGTPTFRSWQPGILPLRPVGFGDYLTVPFKAMRYNRAVVLGGPLVFNTLATAAGAVATWLLLTDPQLDLLAPVPNTTGISSATIGVLIGAMLLTIIADVLSTAVVAPGVARAVLGEKLSFGEAMRAVGSRAGALAGLWAIVSAVSLVILMLLVAPIIGIAASSSDAGIAVLVGLLVIIGLATLPLLLIVELVSSVATPIVVLEKTGPVKALRRAVTLLRGRFWWSVLIVLVVFLMIWAVSSVLQTVGQFGFSFAFLVAPEDFIVGVIIFIVVYGGSLLVSYVFQYAYLGSLFTLMHIDLRIRQEGFDLQLAEAAEARRKR